MIRLLYFQIWDLADPDGKGFLDKQVHICICLTICNRSKSYIYWSLFLVVCYQGFYVALRLVACAQSGSDISLNSLNLSVPPPKFVSRL